MHLRLQRGILEIFRSEDVGIAGDGVKHTEVGKCARVGLAGAGRHDAKPSTLGLAQNVVHSHVATVPAKLLYDRALDAKDYRRAEDTLRLAHLPLLVAQAD